MRSAIWLALGLCLGSSLPTLASTLYAEGVFSAPDSGLEWSSGCSKPVFPDFGSADRFQAESTKAQFADYQTCLKNHARDDAQYAAQLIADSAQAELQAAQRDARAAGWNLN